MLLDIQKMIAKGRPGYERWAKVHNIKQMAQTLLFLEEHGLRDYEELAEKARMFLPDLLRSRNGKSS